MTPNRRYLLVQARTANDPMREHELQCFLQTTGLPRELLDTYNVVLEEPHAKELLDEHAAVFIGGSGDFSIGDGTSEHFLENAVDFMRRLVDRRKPLFGSCFGLHMLAEAMGGRVITDKSRQEIGTFRLSLTAEAQDDPIFGALPESFWAQLGHKDRVDEMPTGARLMVTGENVEVQALRFEDLPIYATQFHPELDHANNRYRYEHYFMNYRKSLEDEGPDQSILDSFADSPEASLLLQRFVQAVEKGEL